MAFMDEYPAEGSGGWEERRKERLERNVERAKKKVGQRKFFHM